MADKEAHFARGDVVMKRKPNSRNLWPERGRVTQVEGSNRVKVIWPGFPCPITEDTERLVRPTGPMAEQADLFG